MQHEILFSKFQPRPNKKLYSHGYLVTLPLSTRLIMMVPIQYTAMLVSYYTVIVLIVKVSVTMIGTML